jgi:hypothetical protein
MGKSVLTTKTNKVAAKKRVYPNMFRCLVLIFDSLYDSIAIVPSAKG